MKEYKSLQEKPAHQNTQLTEVLISKHYNYLYTMIEKIRAHSFNAENSSILGSQKLVDALSSYICDIKPLQRKKFKKIAQD